MKKLAALLFSIFLMGLYSIQALAATTVTVIAGIPTIYTNTDPTSNQYSSHWEYWSQGASIYLNSGDTSKLRNMPQYGCHVVAQSKLLVEAGLASSDVTVFHPDIYFAWTVANGYQNSSPWEWEIGQAVRAWGALKGTQISLDTVSYSGNPNQVMNYIRDGKYVIMGHERHHAYIGRSASLNANQPIVLDSLGEISCAAYQAVTLKSYDRIDGGTFDTVYVYTVGRIPGTIDVNGCLDGNNSDSLGGYGTFDLYINNVCAANDVNDFYNKYDSDVIYEIRDIKANPGYEYLGVKSGNTTGAVGAAQIAEIRLDFARQGNLFVKGLLDGVIDQSIMGYGTFDVYINGILDEENCVAYNKQWPTGTAYEIKNIQTADHKNYEEETSKNLTGTITSSTETMVVLAFTTDGTATTEWQIGKVLPGNLDPEMLDIEYQHHYETVSRTSPGVDWVQNGVNQTYYENSGSVEEYPYERTTTETYAYVGGYYYHWCGSNNNCNYEKVPGKYETYHGPSDLDSFNVVEIGTDTNNPLVKYYKLKWKTGEWAGGLATCATGQTAYWYRMYQYQPKTFVTEYIWTKDTDWIDTLDLSATSYNVRWRLKQGVSQNPENIIEIKAPDSVTLSVGENYHLDVIVIPYGIDTQTLTYVIENTQLFEIDDNNNIYCKYVKENASTTLTISAPNGVTKKIQLFARASASSQWQTDIPIPENVDPALLNIEYKHHYEAVSRTSPGMGWIQEGVNRTYYENIGAVEEYPYEQATSDTYVYVGGYYYHWCGSNNNCNYEKVPGKYETYHGPNDLYAFDVVETGTDTNNPLVKYYRLRWKTGEWSGGLATCATGQTSYWYKIYQYQPKVLVTEYNWTKDTEWTNTLDTDATSYTIRWRLNLQTNKEDCMYLPENTKVIEDYAFAGTDARYFFLPSSTIKIGDYAFPSNSYVFLNTANLINYNFAEDNVWFIENSNSYNRNFADAHNNYLLRSESTAD